MPFIKNIDNLLAAGLNSDLSRDNTASHTKKNLIIRLFFISILLAFSWVLISDSRFNKSPTKKNTFSNLEKKSRLSPAPPKPQKNFSSKKQTHVSKLNKTNTSSHKSIVSARVANKAKIRATSKVSDSQNKKKTSKPINAYKQNELNLDNEETTYSRTTNPRLTGQDSINQEKANVGGGYSVLASNPNQAADTSILPTEEIETIQAPPETTIAGTWEIYTDSLGEVSNILDPENETNQVIQLEGNEEDTGFRNTFEKLVTDKDSIEWKMNYAEDYTVYVSCETTLGHRYLYYTPDDFDNLEANFFIDETIADDKEHEYIHHGLNSETQDGQWHTIKRNLQEDLQEAQPDNEIISVDAFLIRGSGLIDDIKPFNTEQEEELIP